MAYPDLGQTWCPGIFGRRAYLGPGQPGVPETGWKSAKTLDYGSAMVTGAHLGPARASVTLDGGYTCTSATHRYSNNFGPNFLRQDLVHRGRLSKIYMPITRRPCVDEDEHQHFGCARGPQAPVRTCSLRSARHPSFPLCCSSHSATQRAAFRQAVLALAEPDGQIVLVMTLMCVLI